MPDTDETVNRQRDEELARFVDHQVKLSVDLDAVIFAPLQELRPICGGSDDDDPPTDDPTTAEPPPAAVTREDLTAMQARFEATIVENQRQFQADLRAYAERAVAPPRAAEPTSVLRADMTDDQIQRLLDDGQVTQVQVTRFFSKRVIDEHVEPLRRTGVGMMSDLTRDMAGMATVERDGKPSPMYPHAKRFEKEIKEQLDQAVANGMAVTPQVYRYAYNLVVGDHTPQLEAEAEERAVRRVAQPRPEPGRAPARTGRSTGATGASPLPTFEERFADNMPALEAKGLSPDQWARRLGYADAAAYVKADMEAN